MAFAIETNAVPRRQIQWIDTEDGYGPTIYDEDILPGTLVNAKLTLVAVLGLTSLSLKDVDIKDNLDWDI